MSTVVDESVKILIIADDLTGAADSASAFALRNEPAVVLLNTGSMGRGSSDRVVAIDTNSRRAAPTKAANLTVDSFLLNQQAKQLIYKKIDSTLRGNWAAEVAALIPHLGMALICPAHPETGRTLSSGRIFVHGEPLEATDTWLLEHAERPCSIEEQLAIEGVPCLTLDAKDWSGKEVTLARHLDDLFSAGARAVIFDAQSTAELAALATTARIFGSAHFLVGSGGLAKAVAATFGKQAARTSPQLPKTDPRRSKIFVVGSLSNSSKRQVAKLLESEELCQITIAADSLRNRTDLDAHALKINAFILKGADIVLNVRDEEEINPADGDKIAEEIARLIGPHFEHISALVLTGGETARSVLSEVGVDFLEIHNEIEPGVSVALPRKMGLNDKCSLPLIVTKAGAFGDDQTLVRILRALRSPFSTKSSSTKILWRTNMTNYLPIIGITMGDAAGVGPEVVIKSMMTLGRSATFRPLVIGDKRRLERANEILSGGMSVRGISSVAEARYESGVIDCIDLGLIPEDLPFGELSAIAGDAAFQYVKTAARLAQSGEIDAICTAPLNKEALHAGGHKFPGHTEMLAYLTGVDEVSMMLVAPQLRVIHVTTHIGIIDAIKKIEPGLVQRTIERGHETLVRAGIANPRIGVCGINPHAGENGLFGYGEEEEKIIPAVEALRQRGWDVNGPLPADTLFFRAGRGDFDLVVAMYHDQGHGPVKVLGLEAGVNVTVGLDVIRTSVDHGTAFDIAGKGVVDERSMLEALKQGIDLATLRQ